MTVNLKVIDLHNNPPMFGFQWQPLQYIIHRLTFFKEQELEFYTYIYILYIREINKTIHNKPFHS